MWAATDDERFRQRADYVVRELTQVQDKHIGQRGSIVGSRFPDPDSHVLALPRDIRAFRSLRCKVIGLTGCLQVPVDFPPHLFCGFNVLRQFVQRHVTGV